MRQKKSKVCTAARGCQVTAEERAVEAAREEAARKIPEWPVAEGEW